MAATTSASGGTPDLRSGVLTEAFERVDSERQANLEKRRAYADFREQIEDIPTSRSISTPQTPRLKQREINRGTPNAAQNALQAFIETIGPYCQADCSTEDGLNTALEAELTAELKENLVSALTVESFPPQLQQALMSRAQYRERMMAAVDNALSEERDSLAAIDRELAKVTDDIKGKQAISLTELGYEELRGLREELSVHIRTLDELIDERQSAIHRVSENDGTKIKHPELIQSCYRPLDVDYPVLDEIATLSETCYAARETVDTHLIRRF